MVRKAIGGAAPAVHGRRVYRGVSPKILFDHTTRAPKGDESLKTLSYMKYLL